jgi:hypothetical protein
MGESPFTPAQNACIDTSLDAFVNQLDAGTDSGRLTQWKQSTANTILESEHFTALDLSSRPKKKWFEVCSSRFLYDLARPQF